MPRESQYSADYLTTNATKGPGKGITTGTYIAYVVRGRARNYSGRYVRALDNSMGRAEAEGRAVRGTSAGGCVCWYPAPSKD
jgi:hypothetical protein